ncbi:MAG: anhydro-N-acetylmuramic acid kinase [bacterium]
MKAKLARTIRSCGVISGTSRDGIDVSIVEIRGSYPQNKMKEIFSQTLSYPSEIHRRLLSLSERSTIEEIAALDFLLGEAFANSVIQTLRFCKIRVSDIDVIGSHGQTVLHRSEGIKIGKRKIRATHQIGNGGVIATLTGIPTVSDFRSADIAAGGEGAPLVPILDYVLFSSSRKTRIAINIGGISNMTIIPRGSDPSGLMAFDCGPGNCMIDIAVRNLTKGRRSYDKDGRIAIEAEPDINEVKRVMRHPYFSRRPPKSAGWFEFGEDFALKIVSRMLSRGLGISRIVRTLTEVTVEAIAQSLEKFVLTDLRREDFPIEVVVTGGGCRNPVIMKRLRERLKPIRVMVGEDLGINSDTKEATAFAYLAYLRLLEIPANTVTQNYGGKPAVLGALYLP